VTRYASSEVALCMGMLIVACTPTQQAQTNQVLSSRPGQLFCSIQLAGGGTVIAALVDVGATAAAPASGPFVVVATGQTKAFVDDACAKAAQQMAGAVTGVPVSPPAPAVPVQQLPITVPPNQLSPPVPASSAAPRV
jgi:hypothetical protein